MGHTPTCSSSASHAPRGSTPSRYGEKALCDSSHVIITVGVRGQGIGDSQGASFNYFLSPNPCPLPDGWPTPAAHFRKEAAIAKGSSRGRPAIDRKSTRLNSSHLVISYAVF